MISRYSEILHNTKLITQELDSPGHIQKIYSTSRYISIQVRIRGKTIVIVLGRGGGYEGIFLTDNHPKSYLRKRDRWLEWLRKNLSGSLLIKIETDTLDRAIGIQIQKNGRIEVLRIAWVGRLSYFAHETSDEILFTSWGKSDGGVVGFDVFNSVGRRLLEQNADVRSIETAELFKDEEIEALKSKDIKKIKNKKKSKIKNIEEDLRKISNWREAQKWLAGSDVSELENLPKINFNGLVIKFTKEQNPYKKRDQIFTRIKSLKEIEKLQIIRLEKTIEEMNSAEESEQEINTLKIISPVWRSERIEYKKEISEQDYTIYKKDGFSVAVGATAQGNDRLRKEWAKSDDIWVHLSEGKSAHAVIKLNQGVIFDHTMLKVAGRYILNQSGKNETIIEIVFTAVKNLKGVSGSPGMVIFKKEKRLTIDLSELKHD